MQHHLQFSIWSSDNNINFDYFTCQINIFFASLTYSILGRMGNILFCMILDNLLLMILNAESFKPTISTIMSISFSVKVPLELAWYFAILLWIKFLKGDFWNYFYRWTFLPLYTFLELHNFCNAGNVYWKKLP